MSKTGISFTTRQLHLKRDRTITVKSATTTTRLGKLTTTRLVPVKPATTRSAMATTFSQNFPVLPLKKTMIKVLLVMVMMM